MRWADERYVRLYTRDTVAWRLLPWQAKAIWPLILRKLDRAGLMPLEGHGAIGLAAMIEIPIDVVNVGLPALLTDGCLREAADGLVAPNFMEAQEAAQSDAQRKREQRARAREAATGQQTIDTFRDAIPDNRHTASQSVTPSLAEPSLAEPSRTKTFAPDRAGAVVAHIRDPLFAGVDGTPLSEPPRRGEGKPGPETSDSGAEPTRRKAQRQKRQSTAAPMPFTLAELCTALRETSKGQIAVDPFDATLAKPLTSATRALAEGGGVLADVRLAGEYAAAVIPTWPSGEPMTLAWLARSGNLNGLVTRARAWEARGRNHTPPTANLARGGVPVVTRAEAAAEAAKHARAGPAVNGEQRASWDELARSGNGKP